MKSIITKIAGIAAATAMAVTMAFPAFAEEGHSWVQSNEDRVSYRVREVHISGATQYCNETITKHYTIMTCEVCGERYEHMTSEEITHSIIHD